MYYDFQSLIAWSKQNYHCLPWRQDRRIYTTLVSELMLQQTTVATVISKFSSFIELFPTWHSLRLAHLDDVLKQWRGLGYYQRAHRLHAIVQLFETQDAFFQALVRGEKVPGVGPYTTSAILAIGANLPALAIDANVDRVLTRYLGLPKSNHDTFNKFYLSDLASLSSRELNEALMDLGRTFCRAHTQSCQHCPLQPSCQQDDRILLIEDKPKRAPKTDVFLARFLVKNSQGEYLGVHKQSGEWLAGYLELPTMLIQQEPSIAQQYPLCKKDIDVLGSPLKIVKSTITRYRLHNHIYEVALNDLAYLDWSLTLYTASAGYVWSSHSLKWMKAIEPII